MGKILGIDVGGTGIKGAIIDTNSGQLLTQRIKILTPKPNNAEVILNTILQLVERTNYTGSQIGCGFPAIVKDGVSYSASNIDQSFLGFDVKSYFNNHSNFKFHIINDADAAGIAEMKLGSGKNVKGTVILLTLGTGIGSAIFKDGILLPNTEFGHLKFHGDLAERYASNKAREENELSYEEWGGRLNEFLRHVEFIMGPDLIILGGGVSKKYDRYEEFINLERCPVVPAQLKNEAGVIGAAIACEFK